MSNDVIILYIYSALSKIVDIFYEPFYKSALPSDVIEAQTALNKIIKNIEEIRKRIEDLENENKKIIQSKTENEYLKYTSQNVNNDLLFDRIRKVENENDKIKKENKYLKELLENEERLAYTE
jgi:ABC-type phosphate transport system auxiliary subunit